MKPVNNYVLVEYEEPKETTKNGLYVPQGSNINATDILVSGKVLEVSDEVKIVEKDNVIFYNKHAITRIPDIKCMVLVRKEDIYAIKH